MKQPQEQQSADAFRTLTEAEVEKISGGADDLWEVDLGLLGSFEFWDGCTTYRLGGSPSFTYWTCGGC